MKKNVLEECPFCGGVGRIEATNGTGRGWYGECSTCYARQLASETKQEAIGKWNSRFYGLGAARAIDESRALERERGER